METGQLNFWSASCHQGNDEKDQKYDKENLGDPGRSSGNAAEAQYAGNDCHNKKDNRIVKHGVLGWVVCYDLEAVSAEHVREIR